MIRIRFLLLGALCILLSPFALQAQQFTITNQQLVSSVRASLYQYDYTYQITAMNTGPDVGNVTCVVTSTTPQTIIRSGNLAFGNMPAGSSATSTGTLVIRQDRRYAFRWSNLQWKWSSIPPSITLGPGYGTEGSSVQVEITGAYTNFSPGVTMANFGAGITVGGGTEGGFGAVTVNSPGSAIANISIDPNAVADSQTITVQTGSQQLQATFTILGGGATLDAYQTVDAAQGGTVAVNQPGNPLNGTSIFFPPGVLGTSGTDNILIAHSNKLPGPIDPDAVAAGATVITPTIILAHTSSTPFAAIVQVTIPYNTALVGQAGIPIVVYWDKTLRKYEAEEVIDVDRVAGTITYNTKHFSKHLAAVFTFNKNMASQATTLAAMVAAAGQTAGIADVHGFDPSTDGFHVSNFSTAPGFPDGHDGVCYGLTSFAALYFDRKVATQGGPSNPLPGLFGNTFNETSPYIGEAIEQDAARGLIYQTYVDTSDSNVFSTNLPLNPLASQYVTESVVDQVTGATLIEALQFTKAPQLLTLYQNRSAAYQIPLDPKNVGIVHSVLVYGYVPPTGISFLGHFLIYDPNFPCTGAYVPSCHPRLVWNTRDGSFLPFYSGNVSFALFTFDAFSSHYNPALLYSEFETAQSGLSSQAFNTITLSTNNPNASVTGDSLTVLTDGSTTISGTVASSVFGSSSTYGASAYLFWNGEFIETDPVSASSFVSRGLAPKIAGTDWNNTASAELVVIIAQANAASPRTGDDQAAISDGYGGFIRVILYPAQCNTTQDHPDPITVTCSSANTCSPYSFTSGRCSFAGEVCLSSLTIQTQGTGTECQVYTAPPSITIPSQACIPVGDRCTPYTHTGTNGLTSNVMINGAMTCCDIDGVCTTTNSQEQCFVNNATPCSSEWAAFCPNGFVGPPPLP